MTGSATNKGLDARARRAARRAGLRATRSRQRVHVPNLHNFGEFMLVCVYANTAVAGSRYEMTASEVIAFCKARRA